MAENPGFHLNGWASGPWELKTVAGDLSEMWIFRQSRSGLLMVGQLTDVLTRPRVSM